MKVEFNLETGVINAERYCYLRAEAGAAMQAAGTAGNTAAQLGGKLLERVPNLIHFSHER